MPATRCAPLPTERVIPAANCSAARRGRAKAGPGESSDLVPPRELRFPLTSIASFISHGDRMLRHGSGRLSWTGPFIATLSLLQAGVGLHGAVGEIGVHHGMFTIVVAHQARAGEAVLAADLFDGLQHLNVDSSGSGHLAKFLRNTKRFGIRLADLDVRVGLSTRLPLAYRQPLRLFSVDGGHTEAVTSSDLSWAACNAIAGAIIVLDDWSNPSWPGVKLGALHQWRCGARALTPFAYVEGKLYLTTSARWADAYQVGLRKSSFLSIRLEMGAHGAANRKAESVHGSHVLRVRDDAMQVTTEAELKAEWHRLVTLQANRGVASRNATKFATARGAGLEAERWSMRLGVESALARWLPPKRLGWVQDGLLAVFDKL